MYPQQHQLRFNVKLNDYCHKLQHVYLVESATVNVERWKLEHYILHCDRYERDKRKMFLLSESIHPNLEVLPTVGENNRLTETEQSQLLAQYIENTEQIM